ncbi:MAG: hypothetical protein ACOCZB_05935 [Spirochaetota bacterium]
MAITFSEVPTNAAASAVFVEQEPVNRVGGSPVIEHKLLLVGQYNSGSSPTDNVPQLLLNEADAWDRYGRGSQLAIMYQAAFAATRGAVPIYALPLADESGAASATGTLAITGTATAAGTLAVYVNGKKLSVGVASGDTADDVGDAVETAINSDLDLPVTASNTTGTVTLTVRWGGESGNQNTLEINRADTDETPAGLTVTVTDIGDEDAGTTDPDASTALGNLGDTWYTEIVYPYTGDTEIGYLESAGDTRADAGVKRMFAGFIGYNGTNADLITALDDRNSQWTTFVPVHESPTPGYYIGAAAAGVYARVQQSNPGRPAKNQVIPGVVAGDSNDLTYSEQDTTIKAGGSTTRNLSDDRVTIIDLVTTRTTTDAGADTDDWRFTVIIGNLQFKLYALEQTFLASPFDQGVVLTDDDVGGPSFGIRPSTVKAFAIGLVDDWIARGLSTSRDSIVSGITASIDSSNPGRINLLVPDIASAGLRIVAVKLEWSFVS